jgi:hypothetical protein
MPKTRTKTSPILFWVFTSILPYSRLYRGSAVLGGLSLFYHDIGICPLISEILFNILLAWYRQKGVE